MMESGNLDRLIRAVIHWRLCRGRLATCHDLRSITLVADDADRIKEYDSAEDDLRRAVDAYRGCDAF